MMNILLWVIIDDLLQDKSMRICFPILIWVEYGPPFANRNAMMNKMIKYMER